MMQKLSFCHMFVKTTLPKVKLKLHIMKYVNIARKATKTQVDLEEFTRIYRSVHQLVAMKARNEEENELFYKSLKKCTELLHYIHPDIDPKITKMLNFSFQYYMTKQEEALDGDKQAARIVSELKPLYHQELMSLTYSN